MHVIIIQLFLANLLSLISLFLSYSDTAQRLNSIVDRVLDQISDARRDLNSAQQTQKDLLAKLSETVTSRDELSQKCDDLQAHLSQESEAKEYLAVELNKAEGAAWRHSKISNFIPPILSSISNI